MLVWEKLPPKTFNPGGYLTVLTFLSSKINSTKEPPESKEDWKRNASVGFFGYKRISRHSNNNPNQSNPGGFSNPISKSLFQAIADRQAHICVIGLQQKFRKIPSNPSSYSNQSLSSRKITITTWAPTTNFQQRKQQLKIQ